MEKALFVSKFNQAGNVLKLLIVALLMVGLGFATTAQTARADVILPNQESVDYCFSINNLESYPAYVVVNTPSRVGGPSLVEAGVCKDVTVKNNQGALYTIHKAGFDIANLPSDATENGYFKGKPGYLQANLRVSPVYVVDKKYNLEKVQDVLRIVSITQTEFQLEFVSVIYTYKDGRTQELPYTSQNERPAPSESGLFSDGVGQTLLNLWYFVIPAIALVAIVLVVVMNRRNTRKVR